MNPFRIILLFAVSTPLLLGASDWPQFRGATGLGLTEERELPLVWNAKSNLNIRWKTPLPAGDNHYSSPIVSGDCVFVTTALNKPLEHRVTCYRVRDGQRLWETQVPPGPWLLTDLRGGYGAPTPASAGNQVLAVFGSAVVVCLDKEDGRLRWRHELKHYNFDVAMGSSPIIYRDTFLLLCDQNKGTSSLIAFDRNSGAIRWESRRDTAFAHSTPVVISVQQKQLLLVSGSGALQALDPNDGTLRWSCKASGDASSPAFGEGLVFSDSGRGGKAVCVAPDGQGDVTRSHLKWTIAQIPEGLSSAIIIRDARDPGAKARVYRTHNPDILKCFDLADGSLTWSERLAGVSTWASPVATSDGRLYFASAGRSYVIAPGPQLQVLAVNEIGEENRASAAVASGCIFLRGDKNLYCIAKP